MSTRSPLVQYSTVQYSTVQYSTVQYSTVQYSTVQYSCSTYSTTRTLTSPGAHEVLFVAYMKVSRSEKNKLCLMTARALLRCISKRGTCQSSSPEGRQGCRHGGRASQESHSASSGQQTHTLTKPIVCSSNRAFCIRVSDSFCATGTPEAAGCFCFVFFDLRCALVDVSFLVKTSDITMHNHPTKCLNLMTRASARQQQRNSQICCTGR